MHIPATESCTGRSFRSETWKLIKGKLTKMESAGQKGALSSTCRLKHRSQWKWLGYRLQQEVTVQLPAGGRKIFSSPGNSSANEKSLYFNFLVSSNRLFVYNSPSQLPLFLYKTVSSPLLHWTSIALLQLQVPNCNSLLLPTPRKNPVCW